MNGNMLGKVKRTHSQILMLLLHSLERPYFLSIHDYNLVHHRVIAELQTNIQTIISDLIKCFYLARI